MENLMEFGLTTQIVKIENEHTHTNKVFGNWKSSLVSSSPQWAHYNSNGHNINQPNEHMRSPRYKIINYKKKI